MNTALKAIARRSARLILGVSEASSTAVSIGPMTAKKVVKAVSAVSSIGRRYRTREARAEPLAPFAVKHDLPALVQADRLHMFDMVAAEFMADHAKNLRTRDEMQRVLTVDLLPAWGDKPIASITRADVKALIREKARSAPIAANRLLGLISKIFSWALDEEIIEASPAVRIKRPAEEQERERSLTDAEIRTLWPAFTALGYPFGHVFKLLLVTGQRRGEVGGYEVERD